MRVFLAHFTYLFMEVYIISAVAFLLWALHFRFLWQRRSRILIGVALVTVYALPLDALGVVRGWGRFNPAYVTGITFFGGALHLEEIIFWLGTSFVVISAVFILAELQDRGAPWWALAFAIFLPFDLVASLFPSR